MPQVPEAERAYRRRVYTVLGATYGAMTLAGLVLPVDALSVVVGALAFVGAATVVLGHRPTSFGELIGVLRR